jgi:hypothetical protein
LEPQVQTLPSLFSPALKASPAATAVSIQTTHLYGRALIGRVARAELTAGVAAPGPHSAVLFDGQAVRRAAGPSGHSAQASHRNQTGALSRRSVAQLAARVRAPGRNRPVLFDRLPSATSTRAR